jgi:hypothetical protein
VSAIRVCLAFVLAASAACDVARSPVPSSGPSSLECGETVTSAHVAGGYTLYGKAAPGFFLYMSSSEQPRPIRAQTAEKMLVFMLPDPDVVPPGRVLVRARHVDSGRVTSFDLQHHSSEYGNEWGTNFVFPAAGCWQLQIEGEPARGDVMLRVE